MSKSKPSFYFLFILIVISAFNNPCSAQTDTLPSEKRSRMILTFAVGMGLPIGEFAQFQQIPKYANYSEYNIAGEADAGISGNLGFAYLFGKHFGIASSLNLSSFVSKQMTTQEIYSGGRHPFLIGVDETYENGRWSAGGLMLGAIYECSKENIRFGFRVLGGVQIASSPETELEIASTNPDIIGDNLGIRNFHQPAMKSTAFAYGGGAYFGYNLTDALSLNLSADFTSANHTFNGKDMEVEYYEVYSGSSSDPRYSHAPLNFKKQISFVSLTLGVGYNF